MKALLNINKSEKKNVVKNNIVSKYIKLKIPPNKVLSLGFLLINNFGSKLKKSIEKKMFLNIFIFIFIIKCANKNFIKKKIIIIRYA